MSVSPHRRFAPQTLLIYTSYRWAAATKCTRRYPLLPRWHRNASRGWADGNVAAVSHGQHVLTPIAAAAWRVKTAVSKAARCPWPLTLKVVLVAQPREAFRHQRGKRRAAGAYRGGMPTYSLFILTASVGRIVFRGNCLWGESSVGRDVHWAKRLWGKMSFHGAKCPWGEMSVGWKVHKP